MAKKKVRLRRGPVIRSTNRKNRHGTNCNDNSRVVTGRHPNDDISYSLTVQKSVQHYIMQYDLKCSLLQFPMRVRWATLCKDNKLSNELLDVFANNINCVVIVCP